MTVVNADAAPPPLMQFPGVPDIHVAACVDVEPGPDAAAIIMECGDLTRTGVSGLERFFVINIDHHPGNTGYGALNWFDASAAACAELVYDLVHALGVPMTREIATHIYLAILTDTGSFHYSSISPRTFDICREALEAGVDPVLVARNVYDSNNMGRLKLFGAVLSAMQIDQTGRIAIVYLDHEMARQAGGTYDDTEGLINLPLTVKEIQGVVFFKQSEGDEYRVSMRSKGDIDIGAVAKEFGGGGHKNAAGCTVTPTTAQDVHRKDRAGNRAAERQDCGAAEIAAGCSRLPSLQSAILNLQSAIRMDGLLVIDKPVGPTSHDVVDRVRRALGERRIGHTGTLDPGASGVLPLVLGRATRLARFLSASDKSYAATVRLGFATDTQDAQGTAVGPVHQGPWPSDETINRALDPFRGTFLQQPPAYSAKKIAGERSYRVARRAKRESATNPGSPAVAALPAPVPVTAMAIELIAVEGDLVTLTIDCSAGFYVRALAHALGDALGIGAHLAGLRRVRSGDVTLEDALALDALERNPERASAGVVPLSRMLPRLWSVHLTGEGVRHAVHGRDLGPGDVLTGHEGGFPGPDPATSGEPVFVRLVDPAGDLVAIGESIRGSGLLHPAVVLV